jgi:hypothetical protein
MAVITTMVPAYVAPYVAMMPDCMAMIAISNNNAQYCPKYHGTDPIVTMAMAPTCLCDSGTKH